MNRIHKQLAYALTLSLLLAMSATAAAKAPSKQSAVLLTTAQQETLLWVREEEKVARDVCRYSSGPVSTELITSKCHWPLTARSSLR